MSAEPSTATIYHLEMLERGAHCVKEPPAGFAVEQALPPDAGLNAQFYRRVGAAWKWTDRLPWSPAAWRRYVERDELTTWIGRLDRQSVGYFELEAQPAGAVQIAYFGLLPEFIGRGIGGPLLSAAIEEAWNLAGTRRVWVHTCTHDHPHALGNYRRRGFKVFKTDPA
ncbi:MAG: GNAT family N-acetyltransferase [Planctomycetales bacterium]|nr:GNAT family N-acetyltransferase [Planctomycetales bacterium]